MLCVKISRFKVVLVRFTCREIKGVGGGDNPMVSVQRLLRSQIDIQKWVPLTIETTHPYFLYSSGRKNQKNNSYKRPISK